MSSCKDRCGTCCRYVFINDFMLGKSDEVKRRIRQLNKFRGIKEFGSCIAIPCKCKHLSEDNKCMIYERRPLTCRLFDCSKNSMIFSNVKELNKLKEVDKNRER